MTIRIPLVFFALVATSMAVVLAQQPPAPPPQQQGNVSLIITGDPGTAPRYAVPDCLALSSDRETQDTARTIAQVLWDDLNFEREFYMIPRDTYKSIAPAVSVADPPLDRWRELGADGLVMCSVQRSANQVRVELRLYSVRNRQLAYSREYSGSAANPRLYAHTMSDEIHDTQVK